MTAMNVTLDETRERFVRDQVASGAFPDGESVLIEALDRLREDAEHWPPAGTPEEEAEKEARFERLIQEGLDDVVAGRVTRVDDVRAFLSGLRREIREEG